MDYDLIGTCESCKYYLPKIFPVDDGGEYQGYGNCKRFPMAFGEDGSQINNDGACGEWKISNRFVILHPDYAILGEILARPGKSLTGLVDQVWVFCRGFHEKSYVESRCAALVNEGKLKIGITNGQIRFFPVKGVYDE